MENRDYARLLQETADLMEIAAEDAFRIRSYRNGASAIEGHPERVDDLLGNPDRKVTEIPGVGKGLAAVLAEIKQRGTFDVRDQLLERYPPSALELLKVQGLGPKSLAMIFEHHRVTTLDDLERLAREQKIRELPRMGAKLEEKILRSIEQLRTSQGRFLLSYGDKAARELGQWLREGGYETVIPAGSLRRGKETVGDLDLLVPSDVPEPVIQRFLKYPQIDNVLAEGPNKGSAQVGRDHLQVDVRALPPAALGAALVHFTGSKEHNIVLRTRAVKRGLQVSEYGIKRESDGLQLPCTTEDEVYAHLGLACIPPELRENSGEFEAAEQGTLPKLLELRDMRGDLHMHTRESDGRATLEEMAEACQALGYEYLAITDHSKALVMTNGLNEERVVRFARQVREVNASGRLGIHVFAGLECDIKRDGDMDLAWDALAELDFVIGSVHSYMDQEEAKMTDRLLQALECPHLTMLAHPTGRVLLHRGAYQYDFERIATECAQRRVYMEINASPERLDLHAPLVRAAQARGVKFLINTDAHHPAHLQNMRYGVTMGRRGWLEARDVVNTYPLAEFKAAIARG